MGFYFFFILLISYIPSPDHRLLVINGSNEDVDQLSYRNSGSYLTYEIITVEKGITGLGSASFAESKALISISLPTTLKSIGKECFNKCSSLRNIVIPEGVTEIKVNTFMDCNSLNSITLPSTITHVAAEHTFISNSNLVKFIVSPKNNFFSTSNDGKILIENNTIAAVGAGGNSEIIIPKRIIVIRRYFLNMAPSVKKITFEDGSKLQSIETTAFRKTSLTEFFVPNGTLSLANSILSESTVSTVFVPNSVISGTNAFNRLTELKNLTIESGCKAFLVKEGVVMSPDGKTLIFLPPSLKNFTIASTIETLDFVILRSSRVITNLTTDSGNKKYEAIDNVLYSKDLQTLYCSIGLKKEVEVLSECTTVGSSAFSSTLIEKVTFSGTSVTTIGYGAFGNSHALQSVIFRTGITSIGGWCFALSSVTTIEIPSTINKLDEAAFLSANFIKKLDFGSCKNLITIPPGCFSGCTSLETFVFPPNLEFIPDNVLVNTRKLSKIEIPGKVKNISDSAFLNSGFSNITFVTNGNLVEFGDNCFAKTKIFEIVIPDSVTKIGFLALSECPNLKTVTFTDNSMLTELKEDIIKGSNSITNVFLGKKLSKYSPGALSQCGGLLSINVSNENPKFKDIDGVLFSIDGKEVVQFPGGLNKSIIGDEVTQIASRAFFKCEKLLDIEINPNSKLKSIGKSTFLGCTSIQSLSFPNDLKTIEDEAFSGCKLLKTISFASNSTLESIGASAFSSCSNLLSISIPNGTVSIGNSAFSGCKSIHSLSIPMTVQSIGLTSFADCAKLQTIRVCAPESLSSFSATAFSGCSRSLFAYVPLNYKGDRFCDVNVFRLLDSHCQMPTELFTPGNGSTGCLSTLLLPVAADILSDDDNSKASVVAERG